MLAVLLAVSLHTQSWATETGLGLYVSGTGTDNSSCGNIGSASNRATACRSLQYAHDLSGDGGIIRCLDSAAFTSITITKAITIDCTGYNSVIFPLAGFTDKSIVVDIASGNAVVILRGLDLYGFLNTSIGIWFKRGGRLNVENCKITGFANNGTGAGIYFTPSDGSKLNVTDTTISVNGNVSTGAGIIVKPSGFGSAQVALTRVNVAGNTFGIAADGTGSNGGINMTIADSTVAGSTQDGIIATTPSNGAPIRVLVKETRSVNNAIGIRSLGQDVTVRVSGSTIIGNGTGLASGSGGALLSFGNNNVEANGANGAFSGSLPQK